MENDKKGATGGEDTVDDKSMELGAVVFRGYVIQSVNRDDPRMHLVPEDLGGRVGEGQEPEVKAVVLLLRKMAEDHSWFAELERILDAVDLDAVQNVFFSVARMIFSDEVSWGRVVVFFHFAYRLIYKALIQKHTEIIHRIIAWVLQFIRENVSTWIRQQGGWEGVLLKDAVQNSVLSWNVTIFAAGILVGALLCWKMAD